MKWSAWRNKERAALLAGVTDVVARVLDLGSVVDAVDLDWAVDFARRDSVTSVVIRPRDPDPPVRSPIGITVEMGELGDEHTELQQHLMRNIGYSTSERLHIHVRSSDRCASTGRSLSPANIRPVPSRSSSGPSGPAVGPPLEPRAFQEDTLVASYEGRIAHAAPGPIGGSIEALR